MLIRHVAAICSKFIYFSVEKGPKWATTIEKVETDLTYELLTSSVASCALAGPRPRSLVVHHFL